MNIKSLLLGSAAALAAVSGAHAADAIVAAEPEPLEYVRICDAYGAGYFYIPGTETCLHIGGRVRLDTQWGDAYSNNKEIGTWSKLRSELFFDTATDTEYGPLKTNIIARWDKFDAYHGPSSGSIDPSGTNAKLIQASISLGGLTVGLADSAYNSYVGYAGDVINDDVVYDGPYELNQITYNYDAGNGFSAVISAEDSANAYDGDHANHYAPNGVLGFGYKTGAWNFQVVGGYDSIVEEGAIKGKITATLGGVEAFLMGGWNTDGKKLNQYAGTNFGGDASDIGWGDWAVWGGVGVPINEKLKWDLQLAYTDSKVFAATTNVKWNPVKDFLVMPEVSYTNWDSINEDQWAGVLRFERKF